MSMTSPGDAPPVRPPPSFSQASQRGSTLTTSSDTTTAPSPSRPFSVSTATSESPAWSSPPGSRLPKPKTQLGRSSIGSARDERLDASEDIRSLIIRSFSPTIAVYASGDTDDLVRQKGFRGGFSELIRPFGETVPGKVVIRDSTGSGRGWDDYGVRFVELKAGQDRGSTNAPSSAGQGSFPLSQMEQVLWRQVNSSDDPFPQPLHATDAVAGGSSIAASPLYKSFLRQLLSASAPTPHETFRHPVACVIAISSRNTTPLDSLRELYADTNTGSRQPPEWVHPEFLRYYVLVHDEDQDDIAESTRLYDQMKRHFGLHCHLLRLRSNQCVVTDDDSVQVPQCEWLSPSEHLSRFGEAGVFAFLLCSSFSQLTSAETLIDIGAEEAPYLFESDIVAIKALVRELVAQSVIPFMENRAAVWNDQVASRRRGLSGRFMSMSRRWAGFGSSRSGVSGSGSSGVSGNYDIVRGFYKPDTAEAVLRKLADFAFMLRDWRMATSTYELLRSDYGNDKAWKYHAGIHEMYAVSVLLDPLAAPAKIKLETVDQAFDTACYSYLTRCSDAADALRCLSMAVEVLRSRGGSATESGARWAMRIMDLGLLGPVGLVLFHERTSVCYASKTATAGTTWGARHRKAGMWSVFAADHWLRLGKPSFASTCLEEADRLYCDILQTDGVFPIPELQTFVDNLKLACKVGSFEVKSDIDGQDETDMTTDMVLEAEETSEEKFDNRRKHRASLMGLPASLEPASATPPHFVADNDGVNTPHDDFERA